MTIYVPAKFVQRVSGLGFAKLSYHLSMRVKTHKEAKTVELVGGGGEDDDNECRGDDSENGIKQQMSQPQTDRVREPIRELHSLHRRPPLFRDVQREERRVDGLEERQHVIGSSGTTGDEPWRRRRTRPISTQPECRQRCLGSSGSWPV